MKKFGSFIVTTAVWALFVYVLTSAAKIEGQLPGFMRYFLMYLAVINLVGFALMLSDKKRARGKQWRIPEHALFRITAVGGGIGTIAGMLAARHKTQHATFLFWLPVMTLVNYSLFVTDALFLAID